MNESIRRFYDSNPYPWHLPGLGFRLPREIFRRLGQIVGRPLPEKPEILIIGCGTVAPQAIALAHPRARITALDLSPETLQTARRLTGHRLERRIDWVAGDITDPELIRELGEGRFHMIHATGVLMLPADPGRALNHAAGLLHPDGFLKFLVYSRGGRLLIDFVRSAIRRAGLTGYRDLSRWLQRFPADHPFRFILATYHEAWNETGLKDGFFVPDHFLGNLADWNVLFEASGLQLVRLDGQQRVEPLLGSLPDSLQPALQRLSLVDQVALLEGLGEWRRELTGVLVKEDRQAAGGERRAGSISEDSDSGIRNSDFPFPTSSLDPCPSPLSSSWPRQQLWREAHAVLRRYLPPLTATEFHQMIEGFHERQWLGGLRGWVLRRRFGARDDGARRGLALKHILREREELCYAELRNETLPPLPPWPQWPEEQWLQGFTSW